MDLVLGVLIGVVLWFFARYGIGGFYTIGPNERAVLCTFGRAQRRQDETTLSDPIAEKLTPEEKQRYEYPQVRVVGPGFYWKLPWQSMGPFAMLVPFFGKKFTVDLRIDQTYLRSQPVNSEEGAPMGIGVWCEMVVSEPLDYLYKNNDPLGSLRANISNATVRCLSNMKLSDMLESRHAMSSLVRQEVSNKSREWGYQVGSIYIRKVHFRDRGMISQIEQKVVNRLRQVTAAIQQDGSNRVNVIRSTAERQAAVEFAKAAATRPQIVGKALGQIAEMPFIAKALFEVLETQALLASSSLEVDVLAPGMPLVYAIGGGPVPPPVRSP